MADGIEAETATGTTRYWTFGMFAEPFEQMGRMAAVSTALTPQDPGSERVCFVQFKTDAGRGRRRDGFLDFGSGSSPRCQRTAQVHHAHCTARQRVPAVRTAAQLTQYQIIHFQFIHSLLTSI